jgi:hypothetical protein
LSNQVRVSWITRVRGGRPHQLDGDLAAMLEVAGEEDDRHASAAEFALEQVAIVESSASA